MLKATALIELNVNGPNTDEVTPFIDIVLEGASPNFGKAAGYVNSPPWQIQVAATGAGITAVVEAPAFISGSLVLDSTFTEMVIAENTAGGGSIANWLTVTPTGTTTPLSIPSSGAWTPAAADDWAIVGQGGADLSIAANGQILSAAGLNYTVALQVVFDQVPAK